MKKNTLFKIVAGALAAIILTLGAIAATNSKTIEIVYRNIKLMIDGAEYVPTDANGNVVEPFIYNGTTYLPVRAVANAFGKDVKWDGKNATVYLGKEGRMDPDNRLDKVQYNNYVEGRDRNDFTIINGTITDINKNIYTNGLLFYIDAYSYAIDGDRDEAESLIEYPLNGQYDRLTGKIVIPEKHDIASWGENNKCDRESMANVWFYGDDELLYKATGVTASMPFSIDIDIRGINQLTIKINTEDYCHIALTDLALYE